MSALRLIPWPVHQGLIYVAGFFLVLAPFLLGETEGAPLAVFVGTGVLLLAVGILGKGPAGVARLLPVAVHAGLVYLVSFFLVLAPFVFAFSDHASALATSVFSGLAMLVVSLVTAFPADQDAGDTEGEPLVPDQ